MIHSATQRFARGFAPADRRPIDEWGRENIKVGAWSPWEGDFSTDRTPQIVEPLRVLGLPGPRRLTIIGPAAGSKSTIMEVFLAWLIDNAPGFAVWYAQDEEAAKEFAETRVNRFLESCERVSRWFPSGSSRNKKRTQAIHFPHMSFVIQAANLGNVQSKHIRHMLCDETHLWEPGMLAAAHKRTTRFSHNRTIIESSTGSLEGDETDQAWHQGTKQRWQLFCPNCGTHHVPKWSFGKVGSRGGVKWSQAAKSKSGVWDVRKVAETTGYECPLCQKLYEANPANGYTLNKDGIYTPPAPDAMPRHWSFHWNCICTDFSQLGTIAVEYLQAKAAVKRGTTQLLKEFRQKKEAEAWKEEPPEIQLADLDSDYSLGEPWADEAIRILVVDCQMTHFWALVRLFSKDGRSRLYACARLESWEAVKAYQTNNAVPNDCVVVDSGKFTDDVYTACCLHGWFCIKGEKAPGGYLMTLPDKRKAYVIARASADVNGRMVAHYPTQLAPGSKLRACNLFLVSDEMSSQVLAKARAGELAGWTVAKDAPEFYRQQLASMVRLSKPHPLTNAPEWYWKILGQAGNHLWDCERYAMAAAFVAGYFYLTEATYKEAA